MSHQALARKYRPRTFADVATQEHVSETLRRAVASERVAHAYLFCGPRGVGKTTLARVLAMALNCPNRGDDGEPCGSCESCTRIWSGHTSLDVVEIDAASNRGVDDARDLRERAMYAPSEEDRYKVYIVDEAHMLTREAWNALLKILEEPPPRVIFVFATTEPQKIQQAAAPILSRCQRFDFRRIGVRDIVRRLEDVVDGEGAEAPDEALRAMARKADGGMRDALSLLDQVLALTGSEITHEAVRRVLGLVEDERYLELLDLVAGARHADIFRFVQELLDEGYDLVEFYYGLADVLRGLLRLRLGGDTGAGGLRPELEEAFAERAEHFSPGDLVRMLSLLSDLESDGSIRKSGQPRMLIEMLLLRFSYMDRTVELEELVRSLGGGAGAPAPRGAAGERPTAEPAGASTPPPPSGAAPASAEPRSGGAPEWRELVESVATLPPGIRPFLLAAGVAEFSDERIRIRLPEGPALERLSEERTRAAVERALGAELEASPSLVVESDDDGGDRAESREGRITRERAEEGRVRELVEQEPRLEDAVEELDLELLDD